jgi:hypothetical protein
MDDPRNRGFIGLWLLYRQTQRGGSRLYGILSSLELIPGYFPLIDCRLHILHVSNAFPLAILIFEFSTQNRLSPSSSQPSPRKPQPPGDHQKHRKPRWSVSSPSPLASARRSGPPSSKPCSPSSTWPRPPWLPSSLGSEGLASRFHGNLIMSKPLRLSGQ